MAEIVQLVNSEGHFDEVSTKQFVTVSGLAECKTNYQIVAIMGPQSSGKSTLLNHVFGTNFVMMDAMAGRGQTTKGIWLSKSPKVSQTTLLVMDLEGSDGRERGEDDINFERKSALFALAVADVLLVNIWCHDIGREHGSGKPLLKTIFQVNFKLFAPEPKRKRPVLVFVIRDKTKTPLPKLIEVLEGDLSRMWETITKPQGYETSKLADFFDVQYAALSNYEERFTEFIADSIHLRDRFLPNGEESLVQGFDKLPGDSFVLSTRNIWDVISAQKDLNLPAHKIMVANIRCPQIMEEQLRAFLKDQAWVSLREACGRGAVEGFAPRVQRLVDSCISGYEAEARYFDVHVRQGKLAELQRSLLTAIQPVYQAQVGAHQTIVVNVFNKDIKLAVMEGGGDYGSFMAAAEAHRTIAVEMFSAAFNKHLRILGTPWDGIMERNHLADFLARRISEVRNQQVNLITEQLERHLTQQLSGPIIGLLETCTPGMWPRMYVLCDEAADVVNAALVKTLASYKLNPKELETLSKRLHQRAVSSMHNFVKEAAQIPLSRMKDRFADVFSLDEKRTPRMWGAGDDIPTIAHKARLVAANVLSQLAVLRDRDNNEQGEIIDAAVLQLSWGTQVSASGTDPVANGVGSSRDNVSCGGSSTSSRLSSEITTWPSVDPSRVLLQPHDVRRTWREFMSHSNVYIQQAQSTQQVNRLASSRLPPLWVFGALLVLGWNEAMAVLFNPLLLLMVLVSGLFLRSLYLELDVEREMAGGPLPGVLKLSSKFVPACKAVVKKSQEAVFGMFGVKGEQEAGARAAASAANGGGNLVQRHFQQQQFQQQLEQQQLEQPKVQQQQFQHRKMDKQQLDQQQFQQRQVEQQQLDQQHFQQRQVEQQQLDQQQFQQRQVEQQQLQQQQMQQRHLDQQQLQQLQQLQQFQQQQLQLQQEMIGSSGWTSGAPEPMLQGPEGKKVK